MGWTGRTRLCLEWAWSGGGWRYPEGPGQSSVVPHSGQHAQGARLGETCQGLSTLTGLQSAPTKWFRLYSDDVSSPRATPPGGLSESVPLSGSAPTHGKLGLCALPELLYGYCGFIFFFLIEALKPGACACM